MLSEDCEYICMSGTGITEILHIRGGLAVQRHKAELFRVIIRARATDIPAMMHSSNWKQNKIPCVPVSKGFHADND
jgi:hypothetical protein